ncbi:hypothetical protein [Polaromonas sp.]|uniref:hypothetical protein n=1 Tax=Polaromonas sp. TaxID=1869339 RepID=UPI003263DCD0
MAAPWVDESVLSELCPKLKQKAAKVRRLRDMGLTVIEATDGTPKVLQANLDRIFGGVEQAVQFAHAVEAGPAPKANRAGLRAIMGGKRA